MISAAAKELKGEDADAAAVGENAPPPTKETSLLAGTEELACSLSCFF